MFAKTEQRSSGLRGLAGGPSFWLFGLLLLALSSAFTLHADTLKWRKEQDLVSADIKSSNLKVTVPFHSVEAVGLRPVVKNGEIKKILEFLSDGEGGSDADWKDRFKENSDRMRTGSLLEVAAVLKNLLLLRESKSLSFREKKMLERARYLLVSELALARNCEEGQIETLLNETLAKTNLRFPEAGELEA